MKEERFKEICLHELPSLEFNRSGDAVLASLPGTESVREIIGLGLKNGALVIDGMLFSDDKPNAYAMVPDGSMEQVSREDIRRRGYETGFSQETILINHLRRLQIIHGKAAVVPEPRACHYAIVYENEAKTKFTIFESTELDVLAQIYAKILQFEQMFRTLPNLSCKFTLEQEFNYDEDCGAWDMSYIIDYRWHTFVEEIEKEFKGHIGDIIDPTSKR